MFAAGCVGRDRRNLATYNRSVHDLRRKELERLVAVFVDRYPDRTQYDAANSCQNWTRDMIDQVLRPAGVAVVPVWVRRHRVEPVQQHPSAALADAHMIAQVGAAGPWVDVTRLQFDPRAKAPRYYNSEDDLASDWCEINDDADRNRSWRQLGWTAGDQ